MISLKSMQSFYHISIILVVATLETANLERRGVKMKKEKKGKAGNPAYLKYVVF